MEGYCELCGEDGNLTDTDEGALCDACIDPDSTPAKVVSYETLEQETKEELYE